MAVVAVVAAVAGAHDLCIGASIVNLGASELLVVLAVLLLVFGASRLPKLARSIGQSARELRRGFDDDAASPTGEEGAASPR